MIRPGELIKSVAGRDSGKIMVVLLLDNNFVAVADGKLRKVEKPKRKKLRHIRPTGVYDEYLGAKIAGGQLPTNNEIRRAVNSCTLYGG